MSDKYVSENEHVGPDKTKRPNVEDTIISIEQPKAGKFRARKVVTRSRCRATGKYPSWKNGRMIQWESVHERNAFRLLDCDPAVRGYNEQPCKIDFQIDGIRQTHYPDILVETCGRKELWEIKTAEDASSPEVLKRTAVLARELPAWGYKYRVMLANDLASQPRLDNAITLLQFGRTPVTLIEREFVRQMLQRVNGLRWGDICGLVYGPRARGIVSRLTLEGSLFVDMHTRIVPATLFKAQKGIL